MILPEEQHRSKERHSCRSNYCHSDSRGRRRDNTAAAAIHSPRRIGCHPDWRFRSSGTPCSPSRSEHHSSLHQYADGGERRQMGRNRQRASWSTSQCADDPALRHAVHLPLTVGHPLWVREPTKLRCEIKPEVHASRVSAMGGFRTCGQSSFYRKGPSAELVDAVRFAHWEGNYAACRRIISAKAAIPSAVNENDAWRSRPFFFTNRFRLRYCISAFIDWRGRLKVFVTSMIRSSPESEIADRTLQIRSDSTSGRGACAGKRK
jgi:hypothetical protein